MLTAYDLVLEAADRTPDQLALVDDLTDRRLTYRELIAEIDAVAAGFAADGIGAGDRVSTVLPSTWDHIIAVLALCRLAAVPALINFRLKPDDMMRLVADADAKAVIVGDDAGLADALTSGLNDTTVYSTAGIEGCRNFADCRGNARDLPPIPTPAREDEAFIFYTSGTTGLPKGVVLAQRTTEHRVLWLSTQGGLFHGTHNRVLGFMPLSHAIGFYGVFLVTLAYCGTYYVMSAFNPVTAVDTIEREKITYLFAIPTLYHAMVASPGYAPERVASLELVYYGGAHIDGGLIRHIDETWNATIRHIYGTTETMSSLYNPFPVEQPYTLRPGFYSRIRVLTIEEPDEFGDDDGWSGRPAGPGEEGELIVDATADTIFSGYLNRPDATAEKVRNGWYKTGDIVFVENNGDVTLRGRVDDMIRSGGENIHPEEVEEILDHHPGIKECSVIGVPDPQWGQVVVACVVPEDPTLDLEELDLHCKQSPLAGYKRPRGYLMLESLPRNAANKVLRRELRALAEADQSMKTAEFTPKRGA